MVGVSREVRKNDLKSDQGVIVVGYIYNRNGMATWCLEAARAMALAGERVLLIVSGNIEIDRSEDFEIIKFDMPPGNLSGLSFFRSILSAKSIGFVGRLHEYLIERGYQPSCYYLNQSDLQDSSVQVPQIVQAWAYPSNFITYLIKYLRQTLWTKLSVFRSLPLHICGAIGYYRKDWRAYKEATHILATTEALAKELAGKGVNCSVAYPGCKMESQVTTVVNESLKIVITSVDLDDKRKNVKWLLQALSGISVPIELTLVGKYSDELKSTAEALKFPTNFVGLLPRDQARAILENCDLFIFGSLFEDWGYVVIEAMSAGLVVAAPDKNPFDEILGDSGVLYKAGSKTDFRLKITGLVPNDLNSQKNKSRLRAFEQFSLPVFGKKLLEPYQRIMAKERIS